MLQILELQNVTLRELGSNARPQKRAIPTDEAVTRTPHLQNAGVAIMVVIETTKVHAISDCVLDVLAMTLWSKLSLETQRTRELKPR